MRNPCDSCGPESQSDPSSARDRVGPGELRSAAQYACSPMPLGEIAARHQPVAAHRQGLRGVGSQTKPLLAVGDELRRPATVAAGDHRLARGERLDGDEAVVLLNGGKQTARQRAKCDRISSSLNRPASVTRSPKLERYRATVEPGTVVAVAGDHRADARAAGVASASISRSARLSGVSRDTRKM